MLTGPAGLAVSLRGVTKIYDSGVMALGPIDLDVARGRVRVAARAVGLRKIDGAAADRRPQRADLRHASRSLTAAARRAPGGRSASCSRSRR